MVAARRANPKKVRILLVEDHPMVRERLAQVIQGESDLIVCGEAEDHSSALELVEQTRPDLVIVDLTLKESHGLDLIKDLQARRPELALLVVSMHDEAFYAERVIRAGARGYVNKQEATGKVLEAIRTVLAGNVYLSDRLTALLTAKIANRPRTRSGLSVDALTDRELRVFELLGQGQNTRQIAAQLSLEIRTVETYRARIKRKLQLGDANELLQHAIRWTQDGRAP
jgi:DNA-binding NarL/FixJ family response regulator